MQQHPEMTGRLTIKFFVIVVQGKGECACVSETEWVRE
jgi:hypothetical protein